MPTKEKEKERKEFEEAAKPLMKYLCENHNPHAKVIVDPTYAELINGVMSIKTEEFVLD